MDNLRNTKELVKAALKRSVKARNSDNYLYYLVCKATMSENSQDIDRLSFRDGLLKRKQFKLPHFETVRRTRQKIQHDNPALAATAEVEAERAIREEAFREFARGC